MSSPPPSQRPTFGPDLFLLRPDNRPFVMGQSTELAPTTAVGTRYVFALSVVLALLALIINIYPLIDGLAPFFTWKKSDAEIVVISPLSEQQGGKKDRDSYKMIYELEADSKVYEKAFAPSNLDDTDWDALQSGDTISVRYNSDNHEDIKLPGEILSDIARPLMYLALCFPLPMIFAVYLFITLYRENRRMMLLADNGQVIEGRLTTFLVLDKESNRHPVSLSYEFTSPRSGQAITETIEKINLPKLKDAPPPEPGAPVAVLFANDREYRLL